eukprot:scaffold43434_cov65-Phaeocystis_antarctica.AAC.3
MRAQPAAHRHPPGQVARTPAARMPHRARTPDEPTPGKALPLTRLRLTLDRRARSSSSRRKGYSPPTLRQCTPRPTRRHR